MEITEEHVPKTGKTQEDRDKETSTSFETEPWKPWHSDFYDEPAFYDILYKGYVFLSAYPNAGKVGSESHIHECPLGYIEDIGQATFGKEIMCRPTIRHPAMECGEVEGGDICYTWYTEEEYNKLANTEGIGHPKRKPRSKPKPIVYPEKISKNQAKAARRARGKNRKKK